MQISPQTFDKLCQRAQEHVLELPRRYRAAPPLYRRCHNKVPEVRRRDAPACPRLSTAGSTPARCPSRSTTIRLKITTCSSSSSRLSSSPRPSIRREAGSILCSPYRPCCSTERPMKTFSFSATFRMRTVRRCRSPRATPSTRSTRSTPTARTQSAGISTPTPLPGCPTASTARLLSRVSASSAGTLWNIYAFFVLYANIDEFDGLLSMSLQG